MSGNVPGVGDTALNRVPNIPGAFDSGDRQMLKNKLSLHYITLYYIILWTWNNRLAPNWERSTSRLYVVTLLT